MLRIIVLLSVAASALSFMGPNPMMAKYAYMNIMKTCIGEENVMKWVMKMKDAMAYCKDEDNTVFDTPSMMLRMAKLREKAMTRIQYVPVPVPMLQGQFGGQMPNGLFNMAQRTKRQADETMMDVMQQKMMAKMGNISCIFQRLEMMDENNQPIYETFTNEIEAAEGVSEEIKLDLTKAMEMCKDFAQCLPVEKSDKPIIQEMGTAIGFFKCTCMKKAMVCMKHGMKEMAGELGGGEMEDEDFEQMMLSGFVDF